MKIIDVTLPLTEDTIVYPNNPPVTFEKVTSLPESTSSVTSISFGSHTGTHIDAPAHTILDGAGTDKFALESMIGECLVFDFSYLQPDSLIKLSDFEGSKLFSEIKANSKILIKTSNSARGYKNFYDDFVALDGDCADWLALSGVALVGIDYLSIKKRGSEDKRAHDSLLGKGIVILEGLNLAEVNEGSYKLYCLPLKLIGVDGAPARVILIREE